MRSIVGFELLRNAALEFAKGIFLVFKKVILGLKYAFFNFIIHRRDHPRVSHLYDIDIDCIQCYEVVGMYLLLLSVSECSSYGLGASGIVSVLRMGARSQVRRKKYNVIRTSQITVFVEVRIVLKQ